MGLIPRLAHNISLVKSWWSNITRKRDLLNGLQHTHRVILGNLGTYQRSRNLTGLLDNKQLMYHHCIVLVKRTGLAYLSQWPTNNGFWRYSSEFFNDKLPCFQGFCIGNHSQSDASLVGDTTTFNLNAVGSNPGHAPKYFPIRKIDFLL